MKDLVVGNAAFWHTNAAFWHTEKMFAKEHLKFGNAEIEKIKFHCRKRAIAIGNVNINKIIMSDEFPCSKKGCKYFASCKNNEKKYTIMCLAPKNE